MDTASLRTSSFMCISKHLQTESKKLKMLGCNCAEISRSTIQSSFSRSIWIYLVSKLFTNPFLTELSNQSNRKAACIRASLSYIIIVQSPRFTYSFKFSSLALNVIGQKLSELLVPSLLLFDI